MFSFLSRSAKLKSDGKMKEKSSSIYGGEGVDLSRSQYEGNVCDHGNVYILIVRGLVSCLCKLCYVFENCHNKLL